jgi:tetratricopeptide (TPR) repeat protein
MYADPSNLDVTFQFAEVASRLGDYEAAIGALERMLFYNPNLPRVKLELGVLYYRIGGYEISRSYFEQAMQTPGAPPEVQQRVQQFMAEIDQRLTPHKWGGYVHAGWRYQTNANAGPGDLTVRAIGQDATLAPDAGKQDDGNKFITGGFNYTYEASGTLWLEASVIGYYAKQDSLSQFDIGITEIQAGPRMALQPIPGGSWKLYGIGTYSVLAEDPYYYASGAGISWRFAANDIRFEPSFEYRDRQYKDSEAYPTASQYTGKLYTLATTAEGNLFDVLPWGLRVAADWNRTDRLEDDFNSYDRVSFDLSFPFSFSIPWFGSPREAVFTPAFGASRTEYSIPDILIDPDVRRLDEEWHVSGTLDVQVYDRYGIRTQVYYTKTDSSLPNFTTDNLAVSFGPTVRF